MSWVERLLGLRAGPTDWSDFWYGAPGGAETDAGIVVTADGALKTSAVFACVRIRAEMVGSTPLLLYRRTSSGGRERAEDHAVWSLLHEAPNSWQTPFEFRQLMQAMMDLRGNAYARIVSGARGWATRLVPVHPDTVQVYLSPAGELVYRVTDPRTHNTTTYMQGELLHLRGLTLDGYLGVTPITYARETIGRQMAMERANARFHRNDSTPRVGLRHPGSLTEAARERLRTAWQNAYGGSANAHSVAVLEEGMEVQVLGLKPEDAQFVASWEIGITDICRWFGVHPRKLYARSGDSQTYANVESAAIESVTDSGLPLYARWEQAVNRDLLLPRERARYYAEFLLDGLQRADSAARAAFYGAAVAGGWMTVNEIRQRENLPPLRGDQAPRPPATLDRLSERKETRP